MSDETLKLPELPARATHKDYDGYAPPEDGNAAGYWAEGYNDALDQLRELQRQTVKVCAKLIEQRTLRTRQASAWTNSEPIKPCELAEALRSLLDQS